MGRNSPRVHFWLRTQFLFCFSWLISCGWIYEKLQLNYKRVHVCGRLYINEAQLKIKREVFLVIVLTLALKSAGLPTASVFGNDFVCWWLECTSSLWLRSSRWPTSWSHRWQEGNKSMLSSLLIFFISAVIPLCQFEPI